MKLIVGVADMKMSSSSEDIIVTYALGSCLGITLYDPVSHVGGILHAMLPLSTLDPTKAKNNPWMFVDTGVPRFFIACYKEGAQRDRLEVKVAGGANTGGKDGEDYFKIGKRNITIFRKLLWKNGLLLKSEHVGGTQSRTMTIHLDTGKVDLRIDGGMITI